MVALLVLFRIVQRYHFSKSCGNLLAMIGHLTFGNLPKMRRQRFSSLLRERKFWPGHEVAYDFRPMTNLKT